MESPRTARGRVPAPLAERGTTFPGRPDFSAPASGLFFRLYCLAGGVLQERAAAAGRARPAGGGEGGGRRRGPVGEGGVSHGIPRVPGDVARGFSGGGGPHRPSARRPPDARGRPHSGGASRLLGPIASGADAFWTAN